MIFLVHYNRKEGKLISLSSFTHLAEASSAKLAKEIELLCNRNGDEIVVLEADNEDSLRKTHSRYFNDFSDMKVQK